MGEGGGLTNAFPLAGGAWLWAERREQGEDAAEEMSPCGPWQWEQQRTDDKAVWLGAGGETGLSVPVMLPRDSPPPLVSTSWAARQGRSIPKVLPGRSTRETGPKTSLPDLQASSFALPHPLPAQKAASQVKRK